MPTQKTANTLEKQPSGTPAGHAKKVLKGNIAAAEAVKLCRVGIVTAYPITPQTTIIEEIADMIARDEYDGKSVNMESEHSVFAALKGAALVGERVFTATSGQGLFYAHEVLHAIAHMRLPVVACNVGRPSFPWNIWADHSDSIAQRDTGWLQFYCESAQEVLDTIIQSYKLAEELRVPIMIILDAFYLSHTSENVYVPEQKLVDEYLPAPKITDSHIDINHPKAFGGLVDPSKYDTYNQLYWEMIRKAENEVIKAGNEYRELFGRDYGAVEAVNIHSGTKKVLVTMATITTTAREVISGHPDTGLLKIRLFKPFPKQSVLDAVSKAADDCVLINIDRNFTGDNYGALMQEMQQALYGRRNKMIAVYAGLGGRDVSPDTIRRILETDLSGLTDGEVLWAK